MQQLCPGSLFGPPPPALVYVATFSSGTNVVALAPLSSRAFAVPAAGPIVTNGADRALVAGTALSLLDLSDGAKDPVIWTLPSWDVTGGWTESPIASIYGGWQTPLFSADGTRFVAGLMTSHLLGVLQDARVIERRLTQRGGIVTGLVAPSAGLVARTVARERTAPTRLAGHGESDRIFPLASGALLHVFSWRGPAPTIEDTPAGDRRIELHLALPQDALAYFQGKDLLPSGGDPIPVLARCTGMSREALDACAFPLPPRVAEAEVSTEEPRERECLERDRDGTLIEGCDVGTLREQWEDSQSELLASASTGQITARCETPSVRRETREEKAVALFVGCPVFRERFHPFTASALLALIHRPHVAGSCEAVLGPGPFRAAFSRVPFEITVSDEQGQPSLEGEVGVVLVLGITTGGVPAGAMATYTIVAGAGVLDGNGNSVTVPAGQSVDLEPSAEGVIVIRVTLVDAEGHILGEQEIAIAVEGSAGCNGNADATVFSPCHPRLPYPPPQAPGAFEARTSTAEAGIGVLLHDRSLRLTEVDFSEGDEGLPLALARTYRSAKREDDGGLMGGWHFAFDARLSPVTARDAAGSSDPTWLLDEDAGAGRFYDIAIADGSGRIDTWRHPGTSEVVDYAAGPAWWVWNAEQQRAERKDFKARVTTYRSPVDSFATLRSYTLILAEGQSAFEAHPYWHPDRGLRPNERRFYELAEPEGLRRIFDCKGRLVLVIDPQLRELELVYAGSVHPLTRARRLSAVIDSANRRWEIGWKTVGLHPRIATITDPFARTITFDYVATADGDAQLTQVTRFGDDPALTKRTRYRYDGQGRLTAVVREDDAGREVPRLAIEWEGDRVAKQVVGSLPDAAEVTTFSGTGGSVTVTDGRGVARTYVLAAVPDGPLLVASEAHTRMILDDSGALARREVEALAATRWSHDSSGLVKTVTSPLGRVLAFEYGPGGLLTKRTETGPDGLARVEAWQWENPNSTLPPGFACQALFSQTAVTGAKTIHSLPPFDPAAPGRACQAAATTLPDGVLLSGGRAGRELEFEYVAAGPHRGALSKRTMVEDGSPLDTTTWTYPPASSGAAVFAGKVPEPFVGLPSAIGQEVAKPSQCDFETLTKARTTLERDARGNVVRTEMSRRGVPYVVAKEYDLADRVVRTVVDPSGLAHETTARYDREDRVVEERQTIADEDPLGLLATAATPASARTVTRRSDYDAAGRRVALALDGGDARTVELERWDEAGGLVAVLGPGAGADDAEIAAVLQSLEAGESVPALIAARDPRNTGAANYTSTAPSGGPLTPALDPKWVLRATRLDADGLPARLETTGGHGGEAGCVGCDAAYTRVETSYRDLEGRLRLFDPGRTDRGDGATRVLVEHRYDGLGRVIAKDLFDPDSVCGAAKAFRSETISAFTADDKPGRVEIRGDSGHGEFCASDTLLQRVEQTFAATGVLLERKEQRFAVLAALMPTPGGASVTRYEWDHAERLTATLSSGDDAGTGRRELTRYALADAACWHGTGAAGGLAYDIEVTQSTDELGLAAYNTEIHHGSGDDLTVVRSYDYDAVGRMVAERDGFFQVRRELAYDSLGRQRAERDVRGAVHESQYDGLGQLTATRVHLADETRATRLTLRAGLVVGEVSDTTKTGSQPIPLGQRAWRYDAMARPVVAFPRGASVPDEAVVTAYNEAGQVLVQRTASGVVLRHAVDALGNITSAQATFPATLAAGCQIPAGHTFARTGSRTFRYDGLGRVTEASTFDTSGARLTHLSRDWDSLSGVLRDLQDLDAEGVTQHVDTFATYDDRGRPVRVESDRGRTNPNAVTTRFDHLDRIIETKAATDTVGDPGLWEFAHPERITWGWTGAHLTSRAVVVASTFNPAIGSTWTTTIDHDELGQRYRLRHAGPMGAFYEHRRWYWHGDPVLEKSVMLQGGVEQGDLGPALAALAVRGKSDLLSRPPAALFTAPESFSAWDDNAWESRYEAREYDDAGAVVRSVAHRYAPSSGTLSLSGQWTTMLGGRIASESSLTFDPDQQKAIEVKHAAFEWSQDRIARASHRLARKVATTFGPPAISGDLIAGAPAERTDRLGFAYGGESQAAHDGCDLGASGNDCAASPRHRFVYDPWGQLEYVAADEPDACRAPGPGGDDIWPVADGLRVVTDALGRRVLEKWHLPTGCVGSSKLPAERDRTFIYHRDTLVEERIAEGVGEGVGEGVVRRVPGPDGVAWLAVRFGGEHRGHFIVLGDADGGIAGLCDVSQGVLTQAAAPAPWFRPHQMVALDPGFRIAFRLVSARGLEHQPLAKLAYVPESGFALDLRGNPLADRWYATNHLREGFFESVVHKILLGLDAIALATAFIPIIGDIAGLVADLAHVGWDLLQEGPSWGLAGRAMMALGFAAVGLVANLGGPPAWGAKAAIRSRAIARAVHGLDAAVAVGRAANALSDAGRAADAVDATLDAARALPSPHLGDPGTLPLRIDAAGQMVKDAAFTAFGRKVSQAVADQFQGQLAGMFAFVQHLIARAPTPPELRRALPQELWGFSKGDACGPTSIAMILADFGISLRPDMRRLISLATGHFGVGTNEARLVQALHTMGFTRSAFVRTANGLDAARAAGHASRNGHHVIAAINIYDARGAVVGGHWIVLDKLVPPSATAASHFLVRDAAGTRYTLAASELVRIARGPIIKVAR